MGKAFRFRMYPNKTQEDLIQKTFGCTRFVYNHYLEKRMKKYKEEKESFTYNKCSKDLTEMKKEFEWLKEPDKFALQNSLRDLDRAYQKFFKKKAGYPNFKSKKGNDNSYRTNYQLNNIRIEGNRIHLPKLGYVKIRGKREIQGKILNATISQEPNGHYYCSVCCTEVEMEKFEKTNKNIGIDLGITYFATMSNGEKIKNERFFEKSQDKLAKLQRKLSRKSIGGKNREKARIKVAKLYGHIRNQRKDFLQKLTTQIVKNYDVICIEDLDVQGMLEQKLHTSDASKIRHRNILDVSWSEFKRQLEYKCQWYGKELIKVDRYYPSSRICNVCGHYSGKKDTDIRVWECEFCGSILDRDINASMNILNEGMKVAKHY